MKVIEGTSIIHARTFADALGCETAKDETGLSSLDQWVLFCGVKPTSLAPYREKGVKVAGYWIGSDSLCAVTDPKYRRGIEAYDVHLCVHERIQEELRMWGVESHVVYPCARNYTSVYDLKPHPTEKLVGIYSPSPGPGDLYMFEECVGIAQEVPELRFCFYGAESYPELPPNCQGAGRMTPEETRNMFDVFTCILRLARHDGHPIGGIEARQRGLNVIENFPYEGFLYAPDVETVIELLRKEETHKLDTGPWPSFYREVCSPEYFRHRVLEILK